MTSQSSKLQPPSPSRFASDFLRLGFSSISICVLASSLSFIGCTTDDHRQSPDEVREKTAEATAEIKRDAKSMAEGVKEGWTRDKRRVDLNTASKDELVSTGLTRAQSDHVINHRPYSTPHDLLTKHVLSEDEYRDIEPRVRVGDSDK